MVGNREKIVEKWRTEKSADFAYFDAVEESLGNFWKEGGAFRVRFDTLDLTSAVELASGKGRHAAQIADKSGKLVLADTSVDAIEWTKNRFKDKPHVESHLIEGGDTLPFVDSESMTAIFSYDAMVHFEPVSVFSYLCESYRILKPGGRVFFHHSNYSKQPDRDFNLAPGWRNYMTPDLFKHFAHRSGLKLLDHLVIQWSEPDSDALSLLEKPL
jgi:ubiquinone/menaquinone biosynthesis C-methylase UbiE